MDTKLRAVPVIRTLGEKPGSKRAEWEAQA